MARKKKVIEEQAVEASAPSEIDKVMQEFQMLGNGPVVENFMNEYGIKSREVLMDIALAQVGLSIEEVKEANLIAETAFSLYISSYEFEPAEIAQKLNFPVAKIEEWKVKFNWEVSRESARVEAFNQAQAQRILSESRAVTKTKDVLDNLVTVLMAKMIEKKDELKGKDATTALLTALKLKAQLDGDLDKNDNVDNRMLTALYQKLQGTANKKLTDNSTVTFEAKIISESRPKEQPDGK